MKNAYSKAAYGGMDVHYKFSNVTFRDDDGCLAGREKLDHRDRAMLKEQLSQWPEGLPVVMEASFGWGWRKMFDRYTDGGKKNRNRGYIKVARELVKVVHVVSSKGMPYVENLPARPGSRVRRRRKNSRSGTGQPYRAMVAAR